MFLEHPLDNNFRVKELSTEGGEGLGVLHPLYTDEVIVSGNDHLIPLPEQPRVSATLVVLLGWWRIDEAIKKGSLAEHVANIRRFSQWSRKKFHT